MLLLRYINFHIGKVVASDIRRRNQTDTGPWEIGLILLRLNYSLDPTAVAWVLGAAYALTSDASR
eukprot:scaffold15605_cov78-Skeletonema_dohrnii-CCMP3373.AAC.1